MSLIILFFKEGYFMQKNKIQVSTSILSADFCSLATEVKKCEDAETDMIHIDIMDGHFVPVITMGQLIVKTIRSLTKLPLEAHLMISNPWSHIDSFIEAGADIIAIHIECYGNLRPFCDKEGAFPKEIDNLDTEKIKKDLIKINNKNKKAFIVINPGTPACIESILSYIDGILIMSVNPGFSGQKFMPEALDKIKHIRNSLNFQGDMAIDGGINAETAPLAVDAGINILSTASYFFEAKNQKNAINFLKTL